MAATDQTYRSQRMLDIVFAVSCVLMLVSVVWMFAQDYYRPWKVEQRDFRDVEEALAQRETLRLAPTGEQINAVEEAEQAVANARKILERKSARVNGQVGKLEGFKEEIEKRLAAIRKGYEAKTKEVEDESAKSDEELAGLRQQ